MVYPADKDHYSSVLHMVRACTCVQLFVDLLFMDDIENVEHVVLPHFGLKIIIIQKYAPNNMPAQRQDIKSFRKASIKRNRHADVVLLHR